MKKDQAIKLRKKGLTYNEISKKIKVPKSTLASWFKNLPFNKQIKEKNYNKLQKKRAEILTKYNINRAKKANLKNASQQEVSKKEIKKINKNELKLIGTALYWAEGYKKTKWCIVFSNSDPKMIQLMMNYFINICNTPKDKIKGQVQIHPNIAKGKATLYWHNISKIPKTQFRKPLTAISKSSKQKRSINTLPFGTFRIIINDIELVNKIKGWTKGIEEQY